MANSNTPAQLCQAAVELIAEQGAAHLTLSAVAERAGVSKGGLLYHFPTKRALLEALLNDLLDKRTAVRELANAGAISEMLEQVIDHDIDLLDEERYASQALLAVSAEDPDLLSPAREHINSLVEGIYQHANVPEAAMTILLATEGLQLLETLGLLNLDDEQRQRLREHLRSGKQGIAP